jgi:hypothetical protein
MVGQCSGDGDAVEGGEGEELERGDGDADTSAVDAGGDAKVLSDAPPELRIGEAKRHIQRTSR